MSAVLPVEASGSLVAAATSSDGREASGSPTFRQYVLEQVELSIAWSLQGGVLGRASGVEAVEVNPLMCTLWDTRHPLHTDVFVHVTFTGHATCQLTAYQRCAGVAWIAEPVSLEDVGDAVASVLITQIPDSAALTLGDPASFTSGAVAGGHNAELQVNALRRAARRARAVETV